jgi:hypothetical protein
MIIGGIPCVMSVGKSYNDVCVRHIAYVSRWVIT